MARDCGSTCPVEAGFYSYAPSIGGNAALLAVSSILIPATFFMGVRFRTPAFTAILTTGLILEVLGFVGRILLHSTRDNQGYFALSLLGSVLGPSFLTTAVLLVLPHVFSVYGDHLSPVRPTLIGLFFNGLMCLAVVLQVIGIVATAYVFGGIKRMHGAEIMAGGLALQAISLLVAMFSYFSHILSLSDGRRFPDPKHSPVYRSVKFNTFLRGFEVASALLLVHSIYRVVELATGIDGNLFQAEAAFMIVNGAVPLVVCILMTVFHPGAAFGNAWDPTSVHGFRRHRPPPVLPGIRHTTHFAYDPNIRKQFSPASRSERSPQYASPPSVPSGSPGLPMSPRPAHKMQSPTLSSPGSTVGTISPYSKRFSDKPERRSQAPKDLVNSDALW